jgi:tetratricopeptide (TPR) repeat protein
MSDVLDMIDMVAQRAAIGLCMTEKEKVAGLRQVVRESLKSGNTMGALQPAAELAFQTNEAKDIQRLAQITSKLQLWNEAAALWTALSRWDANSPELLRAAARALSRCQDWDEAASTWMQLLKIDPTDSEATAALAKAEQFTRPGG